MNTSISKAIQIVGSQKALADLTGCTQAAISKLFRGKSARPSAELAVAIEKATSGKVSRADLRPDIFGDQAA